MFAYSLNNPVCFYDPTGNYAHVYDDRTNDELYEGIMDAGGGGGRLSTRGASGGASGSINWSDFVSAMSSAAKGLSMAAGTGNTFASENHHVLSNKNKTYTPQYKEIADRYNMSLSSQENIVRMNGHKGRHTNGYHNFMLYSLRELDVIANGNPVIFREGFHVMIEYLQTNDWLLYAR